MNKQILFLLLSALVCTAQGAISTKKTSKRPKKAFVAKPAKPRIRQSKPAPKVNAPKLNPSNALLPQPAILPAPTTTPTPPVQPAQPVQKQGIIEIKLSDKTIYLDKKQAEKLNSQKIEQDSDFRYLDYPRPVDLTFMDSKTFEFMQRLASLDAQKLFNFLDKASDDAFTLIKFNANRLRLKGKFKLARQIKMTQDPQRYGETFDWASGELGGYLHYEISSEGDIDYSRYSDKNKQYFGDYYWQKYEVDYNLYNQSPEEYEKEAQRVQKAYQALNIIVAQINYFQGVFQKPLRLNTDFLKECFYKLDISHQNKLINDNLVVLS